MAGLLDLLGLQGGSGLLGALFGQQQQQKPQYEWMPPPEQKPGIMGNLADKKYQLGGYLSGALMPGSTEERIARGFQGMMTGANNDILQAQRMDALKQHREQGGAAAALIDKQGGLSPEQKRFFATNPEAWKAYSTGMVNPQMTVAPDGTILMQKPFGGVGIGGGVPISEPTEVVNKDGSKSKGFLVKPSLTNPTGDIRMPGGGGGSGQPVSALSPAAVQEQEAVGKSLGGDYKDVQDKAKSATSTIQTLRVMNKLSPEAYGGAAAPLKQYLSSVAVSFGMAPESVRKAATAGELFTSMANQLVLDATGGSLGAQISNSDRDFIQARFPQLSQTPGGRQELIQYLTALKQREADLGSLANTYRSTNGPGGGSMLGFNEYAAKWANERPLFPAAPPVSSFNDRFVTPPAQGTGGSFKVLGVR